MLLHVDIGGHGDHSMKLFDSPKHCSSGQWLLTCLYFKRCSLTLSQELYIWLWFLVHICKIMISLARFFIFSIVFWVVLHLFHMGVIFQIIDNVVFKQQQTDDRVGIGSPLGPLQYIFGLPWAKLFRWIPFGI